MAMSAEQRKLLNLPAVGVDISVQGVVNDRVSVVVDGEGKVMVVDKNKTETPLSLLLNYAASENIAPLPRYDQLAPGIAGIMAQENLTLQSAVGEQVLRALHRLRSSQPL